MSAQSNASSIDISLAGWGWVWLDSVGASPEAPAMARAVHIPPRFAHTREPHRHVVGRRCACAMCLARYWRGLDTAARIRRHPRLPDGERVEGCPCRRCVRGR